MALYFVAVLQSTSLIRVPRPGHLITHWYNELQRANVLLFLCMKAIQLSMQLYTTKHRLMQILFFFGRGYLQLTVNSQKTLKWLFTVDCQ